MVMTKEGGDNLRKSMIARYGSEEAWKAEMRKRASLGGKKGTTGGFHWMKQNGMDEEIRRSGAKGGRISRRKK